MIKLLSRKPTALRLVNPSAAKIKIFTASARSEERFSRNAETDLVCRLLLEKKNGLDYAEMERRGVLLAVADVRLAYIKQARFGHRLTCQSRLTKVERV